MTVRKIVNGELRAYIQWEGHWRHAYILSSYDQTTITGEIVRMINFKLDKRTKTILQAEKIKFHKKKPTVRSQKRSEGA